jgi:hypothetical protein
MIISDVSALNKYLSKPKAVKLDEDTTVLVKQLRNAELVALQEKCKSLETTENGTQNTQPIAELLASLLVDEKGALLYTTPEQIADLASNVTLDFIRVFFLRVWEAYGFGEKELASAEAQFPLKPNT